MIIDNVRWNKDEDEEERVKKELHFIEFFTELECVHSKQGRLRTFGVIDMPLICI